MCVYSGDNAEHLESAVDSILHQSVQPSEVVLVVDGPVPSSVESVISEYGKLPYFKIVKLEENQGHGIARRVCLSNCTHDIVALMDADDISVPQRFEKELAVLLKRDDLSIVGGDIAEFIDGPDNVVCYRKVPSEDKDIKEYMKKHCPMNQMTVMFRKSDVERAGGYLDWYCEEDYYLWLRMYLAGMNFANIPEVLVNVRVSKETYQRRGGIRYFNSEAKLQRYMLQNRIIRVPTYISNMLKRLIVQVLLPNRIRGWAFQRFAREQKDQ